jgi:hypothetical protein
MKLRFSIRVWYLGGFARQLQSSLLLPQALKASSSVFRVKSANLSSKPVHLPLMFAVQESAAQSVHQRKQNK